MRMTTIRCILDDYDYYMMDLPAVRAFFDTKFSVITESMRMNTMDGSNNIAWLRNASWKFRRFVCDLVHSQGFPFTNNFV